VANITPLTTEMHMPEATNGVQSVNCLSLPVISNVCVAMDFSEQNLIKID